MTEGSFVVLAHFSEQNSEVRFIQVADELRRRAEGFIERETRDFTKLYNLLKAQPRGEPGRLLTKGQPNRFGMRIGKQEFILIITNYSEGWFVSVENLD